MIDLDSAATTPVRREVLEEMWPYLTAQFGNPSSRHGAGDAAARALTAARARVAAVFGARPAEIVFTAGGTEADNLAIKGIVLGAGGIRHHVVVSAIEHPAVVESVDYLTRFHDVDVTVLPVDETGTVSADVLGEAIRKDTVLVSVMLANNEIGTVQNIPALAAVAHEYGVPFHTDAVQAMGWVDAAETFRAVDALSVSGHKIGAPKGVGVLVKSQRIHLEPVIHGGGQESNRRSGTENVAFAVGLACALELAESERVDAVPRTVALRDTFITQVLERVPEARLTGHPSERLPSIASFVFPGIDGEAMLLGLEERGIFASSGSACGERSEASSAVLRAVGYTSEVAQTAVRFTLSSATTGQDLEEAANAVLAARGALIGLG